MDRDHFTDMKDEARATKARSKELVDESLNGIGYWYSDRPLHISPFQRRMILKYSNLSSQMRHRERSPPGDEPVEPID